MFLAIGAGVVLALSGAFFDWGVDDGDVHIG